MHLWSRRRPGLPDDWRERAARLVPWFDPLVDAEQELAGQLSDRMFREKHWEAAGGMELDDDVRLTISLQASLLVLGLSFDHLRMASTIIVYPSTMISYREQRGPVSGTVSSGPTYLLGEASHGRGPVVIAWDTAQRNARRPDKGHDVVLHEFAHKIDMLDGVADGAPRHSSRIDRERWQRVCTAEYQAVRAARAADRQREMVAAALDEEPAPRAPRVIDDYAGTNPSEFFAVVTETFFTRPGALRDHNTELYDAFADYYRQDPASLPDPT
jgi:Mlc titration factor MtfA (ptsG expression regulator)